MLKCLMEEPISIDLIIPHPQWEYYGYSPEEITQQIKIFNPDAVGVSCISSYHFPETLDLCKKIKIINQNIITLTGGTHPTFLAKEIMNKNAEIDFIILGEGEQTLYSLLTAIDQKKSYAHLDGLAFFNKGRVHINPKTQFITNLDTLPFPALDFFPLDFYEKNAVPFSVTFRNRKTAPIVTSRGCKANCIFCASRNFLGSLLSYALSKKCA